MMQLPASGAPIEAVAGLSVHGARGLPDRIVLTPGADPAREMAVSWRTDTRQLKAEVQLGPAFDGPALEAGASTLAGHTRPLSTANGQAHYHQARFAGLSPDSVYVYRLKGADGWSEWLQFRTAATDFRPFRFIYLGDTQNGILSLASRVIRQAFHATSSPALVVHSGDLVSQGEGANHDDEWGEWNLAGGHHYATVPQLPTSGNHEYLKSGDGAGAPLRVLGPHWAAQFALPDNGAEGAAATTYTLDYQGVRFVVLDGTSALELGTLEAQSRWLDAALATDTVRWKIVLMHQPLFTCARPQDTEVLKSAWQAVFERHRVDLVLQGHDHCYSRISGGARRAEGQSPGVGAVAPGPVYLVSVTGSKMYALNERALSQPDRVAEDTQFYQTVEVEEDRLALRAYTASGRVYDGFDIVRDKDGRKRLVEALPVPPPTRRCEGADGPDGVPCTTRAK